MTTRVLPAGYEIVQISNGFRFIQTPDRKLIPNQGTRPVGLPDKSTDEQIINDFFVWYDNRVACGLPV